MALFTGKPRCLPSSARQRWTQCVIYKQAAVVEIRLRQLAAVLPTKCAGTGLAEQPWERPFFTSCFQVDLSAAAASQVFVLMPRALRSRLQICSCTAVAGVLLVSFLSPAHHREGPWGCIDLSSMQQTWPNHLMHLCLRRANMVRMPAVLSTALFVALSLHEMRRMCLKQCIFIWKLLSLLSCQESIVQDSLPYRRVLTTQILYTWVFVCSVSLLFIQTLFVSLVSVVAAFPMRLLSSVSREWLSVWFFSPGRRTHGWLWVRTRGCWWKVAHPRPVPWPGSFLG